MGNSDASPSTGKKPGSVLRSPLCAAPNLSSTCARPFSNPCCLCTTAPPRKESLPSAAHFTQARRGGGRREHRTLVSATC